jgi:hypothetical protein
MGAVIPLRTPWRTLLRMANARRVQSVALRERGEDTRAWSFVDDARALEARAYELRGIESRALDAQRRHARDLARGASALLEHIAAHPMRNR